MTLDGKDYKGDTISSKVKIHHDDVQATLGLTNDKLSLALKAKDYEVEGARVDLKGAAEVDVTNLDTWKVMGGLDVIGRLDCGDKFAINVSAAICSTLLMLPVGLP